MHYHNITTDDMLNGDGLRTVLWVAGCAHKCPGCHNPITWDINGGLEFDGAAEEELFEKLRPDHISGLTLSGGDPLHPDNISEVIRLCRRFRREFPQKDIWLYTGYTYEEIVDEKDGLEIADLVDVIVDGRFIAEQFDAKLHWKGSANQRVIDVKETRKIRKIVLFD